MYFGILHYVIILIFIVIFVLLMVLIFYKCKSQKEMIALGVTNFLLTSIVGFSVLMIIDNNFKSAIMKNEKTFRVLRNESLQFSADIYNNGKMPLKTCDVSLTLINTAPKKVGGDVFDFGKGFDMFILSKKNQNNAKTTKTFSVNLKPGYTTKVVFNVPFPPHFESYKTITRLECK